ncbi:MAG: hypothetical protein C5B50_07700 [Verrucomicrobia bacterium]|nr:MAG: hypothetical protein C5B50_07700 [Verrucomicrobiota bacterium]
MVRGTSEAVTKPVPFLNSTIPFAAQVSLTQSNTPIWMEVEIRHSWLGKLLSFLYQAPDCYLSLSAPGRPVSYFKFVTTVGGTGCLLSPYIFNKYDLLQFYLGDASPDRMTIPESFSFLTRPGDQKFFSNDIRLRLYPAAKPIVTGPTDRSLEAALAKMLGDTLAANGKMDEALVQYTNALQLEPDFADACFSLGATLLRIGRAQDALPHLNKAFELQPTDRFSQPMLHYLLGEALSSAGQPRAAIDHFSRALEVQPDLLTACNSLAWLLATCQDDALRNGHRAVALARRAVRLSHGNNPAFMATLAAAYAETGRFEQAQETAQRAILLALDQNNSDLASNLQRQLDLYRMNSPCRSY